MRKNDQRCTSRKEDWKDFLKSLYNLVMWIPRAYELRVLNHYDYWPDNPRVLHEVKNIIVEEWRRLTGKCPDDTDSKSGV